MDAADRARRRILLKRLNDAYICAQRCTEDSSLKNRLDIWCSRLPEMYKSFDDAHIKIVSHIDPEDVDNCNLEDEIRTSFDETYLEILDIKNRIFPKNQNATSSSIVVNSKEQKSNVKLPRIALKTFEGDYKSWLPFRDLFDTLIHKNETLSNVEKFSYLLSSLQGPALQLIKVFPLSDANYLVAYETLTDRYENKRHLAFVSWEAIANCKLAANTSLALRQLLDTFSENLAILKNLGLPVEQWDFPLFHTLLTKLHSTIRKEFEMLEETSQAIPTFNSLKKFVLKYCQAWERSSSPERSQTTVAGSSVKPVAGATAAKRFSAAKLEKQSPQTTLVASTLGVCLYCSKEHFISQCPDFQSLSPHARFEAVKAGRWCLNCLRMNHTIRTCQSKSSCRHCGRRHHTLLHLNSPSKAFPVPREVDPPESTQSTADDGPSTENVAAVNVLANTVRAARTVLLSTAKIEVKDSWGNYQEVRVMLDSGSQANFMTDSCVRKLGLSKSRSGVPVYGLSNSEVSDLGKVYCCIRPRGSSENIMTLEAIVVPKICRDMPSSKLDTISWTMFKGVQLADPTYDVPGPVDVLVGAELWPSIYQPGSIPATDSSPMALNTIFGWVLMGSVPCEVAKPLNVCLSITDAGMNAAIQRLWEIENIPGDHVSSPEDQLCEDVFTKTHSRDKQGRYIVELPLTNDEAQFSGMYHVALRRLYACEKKLKQQPALYEAYLAFMKDYLDNKHMSIVPVGDRCRSDAYYIPHHCVLNENSTTTRLRVVFDASAKDNLGHSLNEFQMTGPKLQTDIAAILLRFRIHNVVFTTDIRQMYRQILIAPRHHHFQRILWRFDPSHPVAEYELNTVTYGVSSSPFLALRTIQQLAEDECEAFPLAAAVLKRDIYVDDIPCGTSAVEDALILQKQLIDIMARGGFELRKWASNVPKLLEHLSPEHCLSKSQTCDLDQDTFIKVLGLRWDPVSDHFVYDVKPMSRRCSKRNILSELARIFDPLGFLAPLTFYAKCLVQKLWLRGADWDDEPSQDIVDVWKQYIEQLPQLSTFTIPRQVTYSSPVSYQLHGFGDASELGYGAAIYIRYTLPDGTFRVHLLCAKSRVSPVKRLTIPRLELCAAVLVVDLLSFVISSLSPVLCAHDIFTWSDSMITLAWIQSSPSRWKTFIANRVSRIQRKLPNTKWNYVDTDSNPADCVSRGLLPNQLIEHPLWLSGPKWLTQSQEFWPSVQQISSHALLLSEEEQRNTVLITTNSPGDGIMHLLFRFSSLKKIQRVVVYVQRFLKSTQKLPCNMGAITASEMEDALNLLVSQTQREVFSDEIESLTKAKPLPKPFRKLNPFLANNSILRVGGRLGNSPLSYDARHPALLPSNHRLTTLIIEDVHSSNMHPGPQAVQFLLAQKFWILSARRAIKKNLHGCIRCFRVNPTPVQPVMAPLPANRVSGVKAFNIVGCDYAGPFNVIFGKRRRGARSQKVYLCLFVCFATKALHLEIAFDMTSEAFIAALRRFIARRGRCSQIFSDCGTNFVGAYRHLSDLMEEASNTECISFRTHPPSAPHFSGLAEAGVKSVKTHLQRVVGTQLLSFEEFYTLVAQIEALLNSRPLCAISSDPNDLSVLTPGHFLTLEPLTVLPEPSDTPIDLKNRWLLLQRLHKDFWRRWHNDYLNSLTQRSKWIQNKGSLAIGDLVIIKDDNTRPLYWRMGRVIDVHAGSDGIVRVVSVRTDSGTFRRPAVKLCPLPLNE